MDYVRLGREIRRHRKVLRLTQEQLAERAGVSTSFLGHIERGSRKTSIETLVSIARALNINVDALLHDSIKNDMHYLFPEPENCFDTIRHALDRLEDEYNRSRLT